MGNAQGMKPTAVEPQLHYTRRLDYDGSGNVIYIGKAQIGSTITDAKWQIQKVTYSGANLTLIQFANASDAYDQIWDLRTGLTYG